MDSHCILACMNIFSVCLLLQDFFSRLTPLHDFFPLSVLTITLQEFTFCFCSRPGVENTRYKLLLKGSIL